MASRRSSDRNPRATRACARCRKRKIKCDLVYPRCGMCIAVDTKCIGFNSATGEEQPRSLVSFLEEKVARLEIELASLQPGATLPPQVEKEPMLPDVRDRLLRTLALDSAPETEMRIPGAWAATTYLSLSPLPTLHPQTSGCTGAGELLRKKSPCQKRDIASIPRNVLNIMLKHYSEAYLVQYPILSEQELTERCDRVCSRTGTPYDNYVVCMALSISAHTLIHHDHSRATKAADEFWGNAIMNLDTIWQQSPLTQLQAIMLITHYGFANPSAANSVACSRAAMAMCVHLGLHREPTPENIRGQIDVETQRRIFWTCYSMHAQNQMLMAKASYIDQIQPTVQYPSVRGKPPGEGFGFGVATANYLYSFRQLESEITTGLFYSQSCNPSTFAPNWLDDVRARTMVWREELESQEFAPKIQFREVMFQYQRLRLNRVSPRFPTPSFSMRRECISAAMFLVAHYCRLMQRGEFFYWHHGCWHLFELGVVLAETADVGLNLVWGGQKSFLQANDAVEATGAMRSIAMVLRSMKHRWPQVESVAVELDEIFEPVLGRLSEWIAGVITPPLPQAQTCAIKSYLLGEDRAHLDEATLRDILQDPRSLELQATSDSMTMEEVFRVLQPAEPHLILTQPTDMTTNTVIPDFPAFDAILDPGRISPTESSLFWHGGGFELDDLFTAFNAGGFY